jgi:hypothetical protein
MNAQIPVPPESEQVRLLELYKRTEKMARALIEESKVALERSQGLMKQAERSLVEDLFAGKEAAK